MLTRTTAFCADQSVGADDIWRRVAQITCGEGLQPVPGYGTLTPRCLPRPECYFDDGASEWRSTSALTVEYCKRLRGVYEAGAVCREPLAPPRISYDPDEPCAPPPPRPAPAPLPRAPPPQRPAAVCAASLTRWRALAAVSRPAARSPRSASSGCARWCGWHTPTPARSPA